MEPMMSQTTLFHRKEIEGLFTSLLSETNDLLEITLHHPRSQDVEGRGFFNDVDFLVEAATPLLGRYNFGITPFGFPADSLPSRGCFNQFDRTLLDSGFQDHGRPHSLAFTFLFKPESARELAVSVDARQTALDMAYQVQGILGRLGLKNYELDYCPLGLTVRFQPLLLQMRKDVRKTELKRILETGLARVDKEMFPEEHKRFALAASLIGKVLDPVPGMPGLFGPNAEEPVVAHALSPLRLNEETALADWVDEVMEGKKRHSMSEAVYKATQLDGLSQGWEPGLEEGRALPAAELGSGSHNGAGLGGGLGGGLSGGLGSGMGGSGLRASEASPDEKEEYITRKGREEASALTFVFQKRLRKAWKWSLYSQEFTRQFQGLSCGQILQLDCPPFGTDSAFQFLLQSGEPFVKQGQGQMVVFSKRKGIADLALNALGRHLKVQPLAPRQGMAPDPTELAETFGRLFPTPLLAPICSPQEGIDGILNYLDHDFQARQKKVEGEPAPLAILIDNLDEFRQDSPLESYTRLLRLKQKLEELNATLWYTQGNHPSGLGEQALNLADYAADWRFGPDEDTAAAEADWESRFPLDPSLTKAMQDLCLLRLRFRAKGSHRRSHSAYLYHRPTGLFREVPAGS